MLLAVGLQLQVIQNFAGKISLESVPDKLRLGYNNTNYTAKKRGRTEKKYGNKKSFQQNYDD